MAQKKIIDDLAIVIGGQAGQGIKSIEHLLTHILKRQGYHVFASKEYMSRIRGGVNTTQIRVTTSAVGAAVDRIDLLLPLHGSVLAHCAARISPDTIVIGDTTQMECRQCVPVPLKQVATEIGESVYANTVAAGVVLGLLQIDHRVAHDYVRQFFARKGADVVAKNITALEKGTKIGEQIAYAEDIAIHIAQRGTVRDDIFLSGSEAVALGALAAGCNFISSYPMSPSTDILTFLAQYGKECGVVVDQASDEIGAMNMTLGAWYAGARAMVTTSGGGFALMEEAVSLAGMTETPCVIHLAQRPGPATGLPTRMEQADLNLALYAGHGEFPRAIFAPGTAEQAYHLTHRAFETADAFQIPAFVLTDQFFLDALSVIPPEALPHLKNTKHITETAADYKRYAIMNDGISPRGIPGYGSGFVRVDSDEHGEEGRITESFTVRRAMVEKRLHNKLPRLRASSIVPEYIGAKDAPTIIVCWGSTYHVVREALVESGRPDCAMLHIAQVYPLHESVAALCANAKKIAVVENNATGQFADLLLRETGIRAHQRILKYDGLPFFVEELTDQFKKL